MTGHIREETRHIASTIPGIRLAYKGDYYGYYGYYAACDDCGSEDAFHAIGLEPSPNFAAILDLEDHNRTIHGGVA